MKRSTDRILITHAGALPQPEGLRQMLVDENANKTEVDSRVRSAVKEVVQKQIDCGIDIIDDGEESKPSFSTYVRERLGGLEDRVYKPGEQSTRTYGADYLEFPEYFAGRGNRAGDASCTAPLTYTGQAIVQKDIETFKAALQGVQTEEAFLPSIAPGTIEHWLKNEYYANDEEFLHAIAHAMHEEYRAIVEAGFIVQIDDPDLGDAMQIHTDMTVAEYQKFAEIRIEALNHAIEDLPPDRIRFHICWGSYHGPHLFDVPLRDIAPLILKVKAEAYSIEAANPRHEHEWQVWEDVKLPEGKILIPGIVGHYCDFIEHPELVAERIVKYAKIVGRENVIAGTDCGLGGRVGHPKIAWAKFEAMAEGARLATKQLWGR